MVWEHTMYKNTLTVWEGRAFTEYYHKNATYIKIYIKIMIKLK